MQTRKGSLFEICLNVGSGILTANLTWWFIIIPIYPNLNQESIGNIFIVNVIFTAISIIRGFAWRRLFNYLEIRELRRINK